MFKTLYIFSSIIDRDPLHKLYRCNVSVANWYVVLWTKLIMVNLTSTLNDGNSDRKNNERLLSLVVAR